MVRNFDCITNIVVVTMANRHEVKPVRCFWMTPRSDRKSKKAHLSLYQLPPQGPSLTLTRNPISKELWGFGIPAPNMAAEPVQPLICWVIKFRCLAAGE